MINESSPFPENEIISFYDCTGMPIFYLHSNGEHFYHYDGTPLAYLFNNEYIISYSGQYLGWIYNGSIIDYKNGAYAFFSTHSSGGPSRPSRKPRPSRLSRISRPSKSSRMSRPSRPSRQIRWSERSNMSFFPDY
ncbi:4-fold beta flower protein [Pectobacterium polaris]|uniref:4-fold beta flower protein n=1 Tax=Pectobacterium polaris TaxID=2042057 RepID=UPI003F4E4775